MSAPELMGNRELVNYVQELEDVVHGLRKEVDNWVQHYNDLEKWRITLSVENARVREENASLKLLIKTMVDAAYEAERTVFRAGFLAGPDPESPENFRWRFDGKGGIASDREEEAWRAYHERHKTR